MKKILILPCLSLLALGALPSLLSHAEPLPVQAETKAPTYASSLPTNIDLKDTAEADVRAYYESLNSLPQEERTGENLLKNLRPILQDFTYYSYDAIWKIYEITDREWALSPAAEDTYGSYDASSNTYTSYVYSSGNANTKNNPYVHTLYRNRDDRGVTVESGRIKEWGDHSQNGGTNREHVWCQSRGFKASSGAEGPAGTDLHHLMSGDGYVNGKPHNNNPYGYVDKSASYKDAGSTYSYCAGNYEGTPLHPHTEDQSNVVFEPQDSDKGDIARACFYMVACYNNLSGNETITEFNPNLTLADYATSSGNSEASSSNHPVAMGILSDLLEWHRLDPVDDYEIHRNNLIYANYQHNRNPFVDYPDWVELIWGEEKGTSFASPSTDALRLYGVDNSDPATEIRWETKPAKLSYQIGEKFDPSGAKIVATLESGKTKVVTSSCSFHYKFDVAGEATVTAIYQGKTASISVTVTEAPGLPTYVFIIIGTVVVIGLIILFAALPKKKRRAVVRAATRGNKGGKGKSGSSSSSRKKKK